jgi:hypothetical protein
MISARAPERKVSRFSEPLDNTRINCFLEDNQIGRSGDNRFRKFLLATHASKSDVVTQQP